jgi:hypothetical protein
MIPVSDINISYYFCIRFGSFESFKKLAVDDIGNLGPVDRMLCGLGAGVCEAIFAVTPMETIKVKFINDQRTPNPKFRGFFHGCSIIVKNEGTNVCARIEVKLLTLSSSSDSPEVTEVSAYICMM